MSDKALIALLTNNDDDVYCFRAEFLCELKERGYRLLISCPDGPKFLELERNFGLKKGRDYIYDDPDIDRRGTSVKNDLRLMRHYRELFGTHSPDVALTFTAKPNVYATLAAHRLGVPVINNVTGFGSVLNVPGPKRAFVMRLFKHAYRRSSCIMFQNETNMERAKALGMVKGKCRLLPGSGGDAARFPVADYPDGGDGVSGETVVFNYIGRILKDKGVDDYIEVARRIKRDRPNTEFNMLGFVEPTEIHYEKELLELGGEGIVSYRGQQEDVRPWIARSHCIIHPSTYGEGMSNVLLENASSGRPIITTDNPGCRETVVDGESGFIFKGGDADALYALVVRFLDMDNDARRRMGLAGSAHVGANFSRETVIRAYLEEIERLTKADN